MMPFGCCKKNRPGRKKGQENDCAKPCAIFKQGRKDTKKTGKAQTTSALYIPYSKDITKQSPSSFLFLEETRLQTTKSAIAGFASLNQIEWRRQIQKRMRQTGNCGSPFASCGLVAFQRTNGKARLGHLFFLL